MKWQQTLLLACQIRLNFGLYRPSRFHFKVIQERSESKLYFPKSAIHLKCTAIALSPSSDSELSEDADDPLPDASFSYASTLRFIIPTLGIWLSSPLMSLVDTGVVGQRSTLSLAALGPATNLCDALLYGFAFLSIATTNLFAGAVARGDIKESQKVVSQALAIGLAFGTALSLTVLLAGSRLMMIAAGGNSVITPIAMQYSNIRILGAPANFAAGIAQAACLGSKNSVTPLFVVLTCSVVNALGDWYLVCVKSLGIRGAAIATALSEVLSMGLLIRAVRRMQGPRLYPFISIPSKRDFSKFMKFAGPIFITILCKIVFYSGMTILVTSVSDTVTLAAHTCMLKIFFLFTTFGDSVSQAAQAFLPGVFAHDVELFKKVSLRIEAKSSVSEVQLKKSVNVEAQLSDQLVKFHKADVEPKTDASTTVQPPEKEFSTIQNPEKISFYVGVQKNMPFRKDLAGFKMIRKLLIMSAGIGCTIALSAGFIPMRLPHLFTSDAKIIIEMKRLVPLLSWSLLWHTSTMCLEGVLLAKRELDFLARTYVFNAILSISALKLLSKISHISAVQGAWQMLLLFQLIRFTQFGSHLLVLNRMEKRRIRQIEALLH